MTESTARAAPDRVDASPADAPGNAAGTSAGGAAGGAASSAADGPSLLGASVVVLGALGGYALSFAFYSVAARTFSLAEFGELSAAIAMAEVASEFAALGLAAYGVRLLPELLAARRLDHARGFVVFGIAIVAATAIAVGLVGPPLYALLTPGALGTSALREVGLFLPLMAVFEIALAVAVSFGSGVASQLVQRVMVALVMLGGMVLLARIAPAPATVDAVRVYGAGWAAGLCLLLWIAWRSIPPGLTMASARFDEVALWLRQGGQYMVYSMVMTLFRQSPVLVMEIVSTDRDGAGLLSAVLQIAGMLLAVQFTLGTLFSPQLARCIASGDLAGQRAVRRRRMWLMLAADVVFVAIVILFGHEILDVFGPHYRVAYPALVAVSLANAVSAIMGFAPIYLLFNGEHGKVLGLSIGATLIAILAIAWFAEHGKFLLVAYAFAIALVTLFGAFRVAAAFRQRKSQSQG